MGRFLGALVVAALLQTSAVAQDRDPYEELFRLRDASTPTCRSIDEKPSRVSCVAGVLLEEGEKTLKQQTALSDSIGLVAWAKAYQNPSSGVAEAINSAIEKIRDGGLLDSYACQLRAEAVRDAKAREAAKQHCFELDEKRAKGQQEALSGLDAAIGGLAK